MEEQIKEADILQALVECDVLGERSSTSDCIDVALLLYTDRQLQAREAEACSKSTLRRLLRSFCTLARRMWRAVSRKKERLFSKYGNLYEGYLTRRRRYGKTLPRHWHKRC